MMAISSIFLYVYMIIIIILIDNNDLNRNNKQCVNAYVSTTTSTFFTKTSSSSSYVSFHSKATKLSASTVSSSSSSVKVSVPTSWDEMIRQASRCSKQAGADGVTNQIIRVLLPRDVSSGDFGTYRERTIVDRSNNNYNDNNIQLVPPDETWQGGIMQLYRAALPTATEMLRQIAASRSTNNLVSRIIEDRSVDESGVDGVSLLYTDDINKSIQCWLQPSQENADEFIKSAVNVNTYNTKNVKKNIDPDNKDDDSINNKVIILLNPQWRQVDDILDTVSSSSSDNNVNPFLKSLANFLGGKGDVIQKVKDVGYRPVYTLEGYVCRGSNVRLLQMYDITNKDDTIWNVFCERDDAYDKNSYLPIGSIRNKRPTYQDVEEMMNESNIGFKYARDIGIQPKL